MSGHGPDGTPKLSDALLAFSQPLLREVGDGASPPVLLAITRVASTLWNAIVHERLHEDAGPAMRLEQILAPPEAPAEMRSSLDEMLASKRSEVPLDARWIGEVEVKVQPDGEAILRVSGVPASAFTREQITELLENGIAAAEGAAAAPRRTARRAAAPRRKKGSKARSAPPAAGEEPWRSLYCAARALHSLAPWDTHLDIDVFGVAIEGDDEVYWCSVMGAGGTYYGLALYRGDEGYAAFRGIQRGWEPDDASLGFDGVLFSFLDRGELTAQERRRIKASGVRFRGRGAWPQLGRVRPGRLPRTIEVDDAPRALALLDALRRVLERRCAAGVPEPVDLDGDLPVLAVGKDGLETRRERPGPVPAPPLPAVDQLAVARLRASVVRDGAIEFDAFAADARVEDDDGWEFMPTLYLAADAGSGIVLPPQMGPPDEREKQCARHLLEALAARGVLPKEVRVAREWVQSAVAPSLAALDVQLVRERSLPHVDAAAESLASHLMR